MKTSLNILAVLFITLWVCACNNRHQGDDANQHSKDDFQRVEVNGDYSLSIPKIMAKTTILNDDASLQYHNVIKSIFVIVIDESKEDFVNAYKAAELYDEEKSIVRNYCDAQVDVMSDGSTILYKSTPKSSVIHGLPAAFVRLECRPEGERAELTSFFTFIEGTQNVYMIMSRTRKSSAEKYKGMFEDIASSFELLNVNGKGKVVDDSLDL